MSESTDPITDPVDPASADAGLPGPDAPEAPAKKAAAKKAPAKKAAATTEAKKDPKSLYLHALPDGFHYTGITVSGPNGQVIEVAPATGTGVAPGSAMVTFLLDDAERSTTHPSMHEAIKAASKVAKGMADVARREQELAEAREAAFGL